MLTYKQTSRILCCGKKWELFIYFFFSCFLTLFTVYFFTSIIYVGATQNLQCWCGKLKQFRALNSFYATFFCEDLYSCNDNVPLDWFDFVDKNYPKFFSFFGVKRKNQFQAKFNF
eukprot:TRINITY_DN6606_c0_g4_i1.p2 TRINITY_DN6606_c0_g4~~TRINITY_DN6606_c0_g4_i1.p2  ORF type:complete len:115 (+),score=6.78 TRINITY_DN6606_c0_g4_i1:76-420(+)